jgi:hypothetical protein
MLALWHCAMTLGDEYAATDAAPAAGAWSLTPGEGGVARRPRQHNPSYATQAVAK